MINIFGKLFGILCLAAVLVALPASAAINMFLDITGIPGESTDPTHTGQVDVLAWSWGMSNPGVAGGAGGGASKANFQDLSLTKYVDKASPLLMLHCANGAHISKATLYVSKSGATNSEYIKIILTDILVTSVSTGGSGGEDKLTENISLNFSKVEYDYSPDGTAASYIPFTWNIAAGTP